MLRSRVSISLRLTVWFGAVFLAGWVLFGAAMWFNLKRTLVEERHLTLSRRIGRLQNLLYRLQTEDEADRIQDFKDFAHATGGGLSEIFRVDGTRAFPSPSQAASVFPWPSIRVGSAEQFVQVTTADQRYWVMVRQFVLSGHTLYLMAAAPEAGNILVLSRFLAGLFASAPILLLASSLGGYWLSRRALRPVDRITATARSISIRNLSERLPIARTGDELERLAETCNAMLARLEAAVNQIKQFTTDASHELRGPLSFVRTVAEVASRNPCVDAESRQAFADIVDETAKATVLLEDMLTLARADAERGSKALETIDLVSVVEEACALARPLADERRLIFAVSFEPPRPVNVLGEFSSLRRLIWILLDNALKYTQSPGRIDVVLQATLQKATVQVHDSGAGISASDLPRIFDRFFRADPSRSSVQGAGLGLAIARWIADMHHASLTVTSEVGKGSTFELAFSVC